MVLVGMATCLQMAGRTRDSIPYCERCLQVGPTEIYTQYAQGAVHFYEADYARALEAWESFPEMHPGSPHAHYYYAQMLAYTGRFSEAEPIIDRLATTHPDHIMAKLGVILKYAFLGDQEKALGALSDDMRETLQRDAELSKNLAQFFAILGNSGESLNWLENAVDRGFINYPLLAEKDPFLESIRGEERFKKLMVRVKREWESFEV
jgi:non-specific serine/threonine protein kinase